MRYDCISYAYVCNESQVLPPPPAAPGQSLALFSGSQSESSATPTGKVSNSSKDKSLDAQDAAAARALGVLRKQDWTRDERDEKGPYGALLILHFQTLNILYMQHHKSKITVDEGR